MQLLPVYWELTLITFRVVGVQRNQLATADLSRYESRFIRAGATGLGVLTTGVIAWVVAVWLIPWLIPQETSAVHLFDTNLWNVGRVSMIAGALGWLVSGLMFRVAMQARARVAEETAATLGADPALREIEQELEQRDLYEDTLFERNLKDSFLLRSLKWNGLNFLNDDEWNFASRVNVLLGKNGYGKTLLFRSLAALVQRDRETCRQIFKVGSPRLKLEITRNGSTEEVSVEKTHFRDNVGKIPLLAIPDSRFVNRSVQTVAGSVTGSEPLCRTGAKHFLTQEPYENVIQELLTQLVLDYLSNRKGLDQPIFRLLETVVRELTDDEEFAFASIERAGRSAYSILMLTAANRDAPLPIQTASQGTLSILAIFGLIYSFLHSLRPEAKDEELLTTPAIVIIDEVDAHLHPSWQQKIMAMLTGRFPNVQFIVSAHSPIIVAGCDKGEVSVLRRPKEATGFKVQRMTEDFLGATARDLYQRVFEIEDVDRLYLEYSAKATMTPADESERQRLLKKGELSADDEARILQLEREKRLIGRASDARQERLKSEDSEATIAQLKNEVARLKAREAELSSKTEGAGHVES
ncbi:MAG: AAA family ATPase [Acidobacteriia bacterium]|nr:AAA family ATPase [Terriglobia bacterium]